MKRKGISSIHFDRNSIKQFNWTWRGNSSRPVNWLRRNLIRNCRRNPKRLVKTISTLHAPRRNKISDDRLVFLFTQLYSLEIERRLTVPDDWSCSRRVQLNSDESSWTDTLLRTRSNRSSNCSVAARRTRPLNDHGRIDSRHCTCLRSDDRMINDHVLSQDLLE